MRRSYSFNKKLVVLPVVILVAGVVFLLLFRNGSSGSQVQGTNTSSEVKAPRATQDINKEFEFPISSEANAKKIKMVVEKAELFDEIVVKGQKATAVPGRTFLIVNIKITSALEKAINVQTRDYIRLTVNKNENELLAPDIHNDPVEVQALSTKLTRVGFPVNVSDRDFVINVGEIKGEKQKIELSINP